MSDTVEAVEDTTEVEPTEAVEDTEQPTDDASTDDTGEDSGNAEAARWRRKLRETETERDALAQQLEAVQRQQVEGLLGGVKPQAVWAVAELSELLAEDGTIDTGKVTAAVEAAREKFGITKPAKGNHVPNVGNQPSTPPKLDRWKEAFTPSRKR